MIFTWKQGLLWIPIEIVYEGVPVKIKDCIIDTGSATTTLDIDLVNFNYKKEAVIRRLTGIGGGTQEVLSQKIDNLIIDNNSLYDITIEFGDITSTFGIKGFIGNDVLSKFNFAIDFTKYEIEFASL